VSDCEHEGGVGPKSESMTTALLQAVLRRLGNLDENDPHVGGRFLALAFRGFSAREHFEAHHPDQIERGVEMAPPKEQDREAWLFGYRFVERKEGA
jgi:hypothetical protein